MDRLAARSEVMRFPGEILLLVGGLAAVGAAVALVGGKKGPTVDRLPPRRVAPDLVEYRGEVEWTAQPWDSMVHVFSKDHLPLSVAVERSAELEVGPVGNGPVTVRVCAVVEHDLGPRHGEELARAERIMRAAWQWSWQGKVSGGNLVAVEAADLPSLCSPAFPPHQQFSGLYQTIEPVIDVAPLVRGGLVELAVVGRALPFALQKKGRVEMRPATYRLIYAVVGRG